MTLTARHSAFVSIPLIALLGGCSAYIADRIVSNPSRVLQLNEAAKELFATFTAAEFGVPVDPEVEIAVSVIDPADRGFGVGETDIAEDSETLVTAKINISAPGHRATSHLRFHALPGDPDAEVAGTVILLHGFNLNRWQMLSWALQFADLRWRAILVDLRGHGRSGGAHQTWGEQDGRDLVTVMDALETRGLLAGRRLVVGNSYGGAAAIHWAARDDRLDAVAVVGAFANASDMILESGRRMVAGGWLVPDAFVIRGIDRASNTIDHDLRAGDSPESVAAWLKIPLLVIHGENDKIIYPEHAQRLHAAAPESTLWMRPSAGHIDVLLRPDREVPAILDWLRDADAALEVQDGTAGHVHPVAVDPAP